MKASAFLLPILPNIILGGETFDDGLYNIFENLLNEDVDKEDINYLETIKFHDKPVINKKYFISMVILMNGGYVAIETTSKEQPLIEMKNNLYKFPHRTYHIIRNNVSSLYSKTFLFNTLQKKDNFNTMLILKFGKVQVYAKD